MEKFPTSDKKPEIPSEWERLFSSDPYRVLDVSKDAGQKEIKAARNNLLKEFHTDLNLHPLAKEIAQRINDAYESLKTTQNPEKVQVLKQKRETTPEQELIEAIKAGPAKFLEFVRENKLSQSQIETLFYEKPGFSSNTLAPRAIFGQRILAYLELSPQAFMQHVDEWKKVGLDLDTVTFLSTGRGRDILGKKLALKVTESPKAYVDYIAEWKAIGIDIDVRGNLNRADLNSVIILQYARQAAISPKAFQEYLNDWKQVGVLHQASQLANTPIISKKIDSQARTLLSDPTKFGNYVEEWLKFGWKPSHLLMLKYSALKNK